MHRLDGRRQGLLDGRLATAEYHRIDQPASPFKMLPHLRPAHARGPPARQQVNVLAVPAAPRAALQKQHRRQFSRVVDGGQRRVAADQQVIGTV